MNATASGRHLCFSTRVMTKSSASALLFGPLLSPWSILAHQASAALLLVARATGIEAAAVCAMPTTYALRWCKIGAKPPTAHCKGKRSCVVPRKVFVAGGVALQRVRANAAWKQSRTDWFHAGCVNATLVATHGNIAPQAIEGFSALPAADRAAVLREWRHSVSPASGAGHVVLNKAPHSFLQKCLAAKRAGKKMPSKQRSPKRVVVPAKATKKSGARPTRPMPKKSATLSSKRRT